MMRILQALLREPLVHFLLLGSVIFLVFDLTRESDQAGERRIVVTSAKVEQLAAQFSRTWLRPPTPVELDGLVERYVRSEIYYREASAMRLGQDDPYVRNRLALKLEVLLDDLSAEAEPADAELARFLKDQAEGFAEPAWLSYLQLYVNPDRHAAPVADAQGLLELRQLTTRRWEVVPLLAPAVARDLITWRRWDFTGQMQAIRETIAQQDPLGAYAIGLYLRSAAIRSHAAMSLPAIVGADRTIDDNSGGNEVIPQ